MSRNRVIYQSEALFASKEVNSTGQADHMQLRRVQSANYSFNVTRTDLNQFGQLSRIDSLILEAPTVSADVSYHLGDGYNEEVLNFANSDLNVGFVSGQIESSSGQNLYIMTADEGKDANFGSLTGVGAIGIGNAFVTDYSLEASVGGFPTVTVSFEGSNINASTNITGSPFGGFTGSGFSGAGIDPTLGTPLTEQIAAGGIKIRPSDPGTDEGVVSALRPSDIFFDLADANGDTISKIGSDGAHVQSVSLSVPLSRTPIERLGTRFPFARTVDFPITPTLSVSAILSETEEKSLTSIIANDNFIPSATITIKDGNGSTAANNAAIYKLTNLKLDSESFSSSVGPNKTVDLTFSLSVGGPDDQENNIFFSGSNTDSMFALQRVVANGGALGSNESVTINGVTINSTHVVQDDATPPVVQAIDSATGPQTVGYIHGQTGDGRNFVVSYIGAADVDFTSVAGGSISGSQQDATFVSNIIEGAASATAGTGSINIKPDDSSVNDDITFTVGVSTT